MSSVDSISNQLDKIYADLESNVTRIYGRRDLHLAVDLVYHSPISFVFDGKELRKGYPEVLIAGDTRVGKTQCAEALMMHYGVGVMAQGECMSVAGLVGGVEQQVQNKWGITWGKLPQNNRRLVILDEASGLDPKDIAQLSSIRSSGEATIEKIRNQRTEARTRIIWLSNPREGRTVNQFSSGVEIIKTLFPGPEDVARFDMAIIVSKDDVPMSSLRAARGVRIPHVFTQELCRDLVLWCWTREPKEIDLSRATQDACYDTSENLSKKFSSDFTLVSAAEQRIKMARMATALAGRLYSTPDGVNLTVLPEHVHYIAQYLDRVYSSRYFGFDTWSANHMLGEKIEDSSKVIAFMKRLGRNGCVKLLDMSAFQLRDLEETMGISTDEAKTHIATLYTNNAIKKIKGNYYSKTPEFTSMLSEHSKKPYVKEEREF
jgi:hypothetical protein